jgi:hypothetical protein
MGLWRFSGMIIYDLSLEKQIVGEDGASVRMNTIPARKGLCARWEVVKVIGVFIGMGLGGWIPGWHAHWKHAGTNWVYNPSAAT